MCGVGGLFTATISASAGTGGGEGVEGGTFFLQALGGESGGGVVQARDGGEGGGLQARGGCGMTLHLLLYPHAVQRVSNLIEKTITCKYFLGGALSVFSPAPLVCEIIHEYLCLSDRSKRRRRVQEPNRSRSVVQ